MESARKINHEFKNVVVLTKLIEADIEIQKKKSSVNYKRTSIKVLKNTTSYGVFIDLGGLRLIHITDH
jgi:hypothetical protein